MVSFLSLSPSSPLVSAGDRLKLGVDVVENNTASHKCVQFTVAIHLPSQPGTTRTPPPSSFPPENELPLAVLAAGGEEALIAEVRGKGIE